MFLISWMGAELVLVVVVVVVEEASDWEEMFVLSVFRSRLLSLEDELEWDESSSACCW